MTQTSDERREAAKKLRDGGIARNVEEAYTLILSCVGIRPQLPAETTYTDTMARLADLIDPTCKMTVKSGHACCGNCGHRLSDGREVEEDYYEFRPYCPDCGARVVSDDE